MDEHAEPRPLAAQPADRSCATAGRAPRLVVVGGGRGGVGKSLVAVNVAVYVAQLGKHVVLVDADATGSNLHTHFGLAAARREVALAKHEEQPLSGALTATGVPGLALLPAPHDAIAPPLALRAGRKTRWLGLLRQQPVDLVVIDVGPGHGNFVLEVMLAADMAIVVTVPEPPAIEASYRFVRAAFQRRVRAAVTGDRYRLQMLERTLAAFGWIPPPLALVRALAKADRTLGELARAELHFMKCSLVVNQTRIRSDVELGAWMSALCSRHYGLRLDELGHIEHDDTVWTTVRRNRPLLVDSPTCKAARNLERIARRVHALTTARAEPAAPSGAPAMGEPTLYAVLGLTRSATDEEIRRAHKRHREVYAGDSIATASLLDPSELDLARARLDEAHDTLLDPVRRRAYDLSTFADAEPEPARVARPAVAAEQLMLQAELAREIGPDTDFSGAFLRRVRESQGLELADISAKTRIPLGSLEAIEEERFEALPALVYARGFVVELAKCLKLDPAQVHRTYVRRMRLALAERGESG